MNQMFPEKKREQEKLFRHFSKVEEWCNHLTMKVKEFLNPITPANAGLLYTTECSPFKITLPGAETVNLIDMTFDLILI